MSDVDLPEIKGIREISPVTAYELVKGLQTYTSYRASDLYERYRKLEIQHGREPGSANALGRMLRKIGCSRRKKGFGKEARAAWLITPGSQDPRWGTGEWF